MTEKPISRRTLITGAAVAAGGALLTGCRVTHSRRSRAAPAPRQRHRRGDPTKMPGAPTTAVGTRSPFVTPARAPVGEITGTSLTPLQALSGTITPADLHFTRIHAGTADDRSGEAYAAHPRARRSSARAHARRPQALSVGDAIALHRVCGQRTRRVPNAEAGHDAAAGRRHDFEQRMDRRSAGDAVSRGRREERRRVVPRRRWRCLPCSRAAFPFAKDATTPSSSMRRTASRFAPNRAFPSGCCCRAGKATRT